MAVRPGTLPCGDCTHTSPVKFNASFLKVRLRNSIYATPSINSIWPSKNSEVATLVAA
jgi:hypothetical protein